MIQQKKILKLFHFNKSIYTNSSEIEKTLYQSTPSNSCKL